METNIERILLMYESGLKRICSVKKIFPDEITGGFELLTGEVFHFYKHYKTGLIYKEVEYELY